MDGRTPVEAVAGMSMVQPVGRDLGGEPSPLGGRFYDPMHFTGIERPALAGHEHGRIRRGLTKARDAESSAWPPPPAPALPSTTRFEGRPALTSVSPIMLAEAAWNSCGRSLR